MATINSGFKTYTAGEALAANRLVKLGSTAGEVVYADAADYVEAIGVTVEAAASGGRVTVHDLNVGANHKVAASAAITAHEHVICAADGKIAPDGGTSTEKVKGFALQSASADGGVVEVSLFPKGVYQTIDLS